MHVRRGILVLGSLGLGLSLAACGSGSVSPVAATPPTGAGATIQGNVQTGASGGGTAAVSALSGGAGLRVSVTGTPLSTTTDAGGSFVLTGVPAGRVELRFEGPGVDARLEISGLVEGQTLSITVQVSGSQAVRVDGQEVEFRGTIESLDPLVVAGRTVFTNRSTRILDRDNNPIPFSDLKVNDFVEVEGALLADGSVLAEKIKLED